MRWLLLFTFFILLFCTLHLVGKTLNTEYIPDEYVLIAEKITAEVAKKLSKRHAMCLFGETAGLADQVNILGLSFQIEGPIEKNQLREILIDCVEEFLDAINKNERIRPHLINYPFTNHEIKIALFIIWWLAAPSIYIHRNCKKGKIKVCDFRRRQSIQC